jgi:hypothetical protein
MSRLGATALGIAGLLTILTVAACTQWGRGIGEACQQNVDCATNLCIELACAAPIGAVAGLPLGTVDSAAPASDGGSDASPD